MQIYEVTDARFRKYGKVIRNIDFSALTEAWDICISFSWKVTSQL